jgi:hypothetical protein
MRTLFVLLALLFALGELQASMIVPSSKAEYLADSDLVVVGRVLGWKFYEQDYYTVNTYDNSEVFYKDRVLTDWTIEVLETIKGECVEPEMNVTWIGGEVDGLVHRTSMGFHLDEGDIALFFLTRNERSKKWMPYGGSARVFLVDDYGGQNKLQPSSGMTVVLSRGGSEIKRTGPMLHADTLADFEGRKPGCTRL